MTTVYRAWAVLLALTLARTAMGFQFQSVAAVGPLLTAEAAISYAALGTLMGIYLLPGAFVALPGGWLGRRFGDKRVVLASLAMMTGGGGLMVLSGIYEVMFAGRLVAGVGGVLLNVLLTKMVTDWFAGRRIVVAMSILISSWPLGISIALVSLGPLGEAVGAAFALPVAACAAALVLVAVVYKPPPEVEPTDAARPATGSLSRRELWGAVVAGGVWCFYNVAFILPLAFGLEFLTAGGMTLAAAGSAISLAGWLIIPALPLGGWLAERIGRPDATMTASFLVIAGLLWAIPFLPAPVLWFGLLGLAFGPAGGLIMALPSEILRPRNRAVGMGIFYTVYYVGMGICPAIAGLLRDWTGDPAAPLFFAAVTILLALAGLVGFRRIATATPVPRRA
jgi:predicted MFS family arabinose efflux permease